MLKPVDNRLRWWRSIFLGFGFLQENHRIFDWDFSWNTNPHLHLPKIIFSHLTIADGKVYPAQPKQEKDWIDPLMVRLPAKLFEKTRIWEVSKTCRGIYAGARENAIPKGRQTSNDHYSRTLWFIDSNRKISLYSKINEPFFLLYLYCAYTVKNIISTDLRIALLGSAMYILGNFVRKPENSCLAAWLLRYLSAKFSRQFWEKQTSKKGGKSQKI